jgi:hypothetical protein
MSFDLSATANDLLARLGATSWGDLDWTTQAEVYSYFDEGLKSLAAKTGIFVERDTSGTLATGTNQYQAPTGWISTIHLSVAGLRIRPTTLTEIEALDAAYVAALGTPTRYSDDAGQLGSITYYPTPQAPDAGKTAAVVFHLSPPDLSVGQTLIPAQSPVADFFLYYALQRARSKESVSSMPEVANHAEQRAAMFLQIFEQYWGQE